MSSSQSVWRWRWKTKDVTTLIFTYLISMSSNFGNFMLHWSVLHVCSFKWQQPLMVVILLLTLWVNRFTGKGSYLISEVHLSKQGKSTHPLQAQQASTGNCISPLQPQQFCGKTTTVWELLWSALDILLNCVHTFLLLASCQALYQHHCKVGGKCPQNVVLFGQQRLFSARYWFKL